MAQVPVKPKTVEEVLTNISSAKWTFGSEPSPWYDVDNLVPRSPDAIVPFHLFGNFPPEIILYMVQFLPKESAISLALTNKGMLQLIGERVFDGLTDQERWRLVLLLERDSSVLMACHHCRKLHNGVSKGREYLSGLRQSCKSGNGSMLPSGVTLVQCRLVMRQYLRQQLYSDFLTIPDSTRVLSLPDFKVFQSSTLRIANGHLLLRSESLIAPFTSSETSETATEEFAPEGEDIPSRTANDKDPQMAKIVSGHAAYLLHKLSTHGDRDLFRTHGCSHQNATSLGFCFPRNDPEENTRTCGRRYLDWACTKTFENEEAFVTDHDHANHEYWDEAIPHHPAECYGSTFVAPGVFRKALHPTMACALYHDQPCVEVKDCEAMVGRVRSCPECFTDRCISAQDVPGIGRVMTLTSWQDLGGISPGEGLAAWFSHYDRRDTFGCYYRYNRNELGGSTLPIHEPRHTFAAAGSIYASYESIRELLYQSSYESPKRGPKTPRTRATASDEDSMESGYRYTARIEKRLLKSFRNVQYTSNSTAEDRVREFFTWD